jgi:hypothetical protein
MRKNKANGRNWLVAILVTFATLLSVSCAGSPKTGKALTPSVAGLVFNTASLDFGAIAVGSKKKESITVTNSSPAGGGTVSVTNIVVTGAGFTLTAPTGPFSLAPGQSSTLTVSFAPKAAGDVAGQLSIFVSGTPDSGDISLSGSTISGNQLVVSPAKLNFGGVSLGSSKKLTATLTVGDSDVTIASASWNGQGYAITGIDFPVTIPANSSITYSVTFTPQTAGTISGGIIFTSNANNTPTTQTFSGSGGAVAQSSAQHSVSLSWNLAGGVDGYNVYRGTHSGGPYTRLNASAQAGSSYTDSSVKSGTTYYYVATAIDAGVESGSSEEAVAAIPSP